MKILSLVLALFLGLGSMTAAACRPYIRSNAQIAEQASAIFIAKVFAMRPLPDGNEALDMKVLETLKGSVLDTFRADAKRMAGAFSPCSAFEGEKIKIDIGDEWVISAVEYGPNKSLEVMNAFPLSPAHLADQTERQDKLRPLRLELEKIRAQ